ncbi:Anr2p NDAI_0C00670 [Naumovozyma dairenensis CBS 421]|uniref:DUF4484 domain-containing protein n=1 Tax=Naumovozyma dairenensis (strain ATCC 10597 / BCRC 20456 / CBS 421 / NBRC 0211 / NRRL Y-12639) TaxID=1071378 RepID=G0W7G7_NAUDC|nr:hypothetical protein NDAI_0C00670 [Naumovozyma dairenensis CBS 421]CCD23728.1 hypothetical protein NDAI_0C00670 [Naumovozyma dairenensis CBS 421]
MNRYISLATTPYTVQDVLSELLKASSTKKKLPIVGMFLCQFDMRKGNVKIWSQLNEQYKDNELVLENIEFKTLPSGLHASSEDVITFTIPRNSLANEDVRNEPFYGVAYYNQNSYDIMEGHSEIDRSKVRMYAFGVIVNPVEKVKDNPFASITMVNKYIDNLEDTLKEWLNLNDDLNFAIFEEFFTENSTRENQSQILDSVVEENITINSSRRRHMVEYLPFWFRKFGPLIFTIWKECLLDKRILILNGSGESLETCNSLCFYMSLLSMKTNEISTDQKFITPLFTVGTTDIDSLKRLSHYSYIACTNDEILADKQELYDILIRLPSHTMESEEEAPVKIFTNNGTQIKATRNDFEQYELFVKEHLHEEVSGSLKRSCLNVTEPVSWSQFFIDSAYCIATAGTVAAPFHFHPEVIDIGDINEASDKADGISSIAEPLKFSLFFNIKTKRLYDALETILNENESLDSDGPIHISSHSLLKLNLDCFSSQDKQFVEQFCQLYFNRKIAIDYYEYFKAFC